MEVAVVWNEDGAGEFAGKFVFADGCTVLAGASRGRQESHRRLALSELAGVSLGPLTWAPASRDRGLVLERSDGGRIEIASLEGVGVLHELAEVLARNLDKPQETRAWNGARTAREPAEGPAPLAPRRRHRRRGVHREPSAPRSR